MGVIIDIDLDCVSAIMQNKYDKFMTIVTLLLIHNFIFNFNKLLKNIKNKS